MSRNPVFYFLILTLGFLGSLNVDAQELFEDKTAEEAFWVAPATVHSYKKKTDLHSLVSSVLALTELEFVRIGDALVALPLRRNDRPIGKMADAFGKSFEKLPQIKPVYRLEQLVDALQIRQISLSDARTFAVILNGGAGGGITPIMQTRFFKILIFVEDILDDVDQAVMFPVNYGASEIRGEKVRIKTIAYSAEGLGFLRRKIYTGVRFFNKMLIKTGSRTIDAIEASENIVVREKRSRENRHYVIYVKMPYGVYQENQNFFEKKVRKKSVGRFTDWKAAFNRKGIKLPDLVEAKFPDIPKIFDGADPQEPILLALEIQDWKKAPKYLRAYVVDSDEFEGFIRDRVAPFQTLPN